MTIDVSFHKKQTFLEVLRKIEGIKAISVPDGYLQWKPNNSIKITYLRRKQWKVNNVATPMAQSWKSHITVCNSVSGIDYSWRIRPSRTEKEKKNMQNGSNWNWLLVIISLANNCISKACAKGFLFRKNGLS